jgi:hypothetical protein
MQRRQHMAGSLVCNSCLTGVPLQPGNHPSVSSAHHPAASRHGEDADGTATRLLVNAPTSVAQTGCSCTLSQALGFRPRALPHRRTPCCAPAHHRAANLLVVRGRDASAGSSYRCWPWSGAFRGTGCLCTGFRAEPSWSAVRAMSVVALYISPQDFLFQMGLVLQPLPMV